MDRYIVFIEYYDYTYYYTLFCNDKLLYVYPSEEINGLVQFLVDEEKPFLLNIIKTDEVNEDDFFRQFYNPFEKQVKLQTDSAPDYPQLVRNLEKLVNHELIMQDENIANRHSSTLVSFLFSGTCFSNIDTKSDDISIQSTLLQAEAVLKNGGETMTELAKIIIKKYEEMNRNG